MQPLTDQIQDLLPDKGPLDKRTVSRIKPILEDLLENYVMGFSKERPDDDLDFNGRVNIHLLKVGVTDFFMASVDFDHNIVAETVTVTALWTFPALKSSVIVDILFRDKP